MELLHEPRIARKIQLLSRARQEVLVLTSRKYLESWSPELLSGLKDCLARGSTVKVLVEGGQLGWVSTRWRQLRALGVDMRQSQKHFLSALRSMPVQGEIWVFDRTEVLAANQRTRRSATTAESTLAVECRLGSGAARGAASYFDQRWEAAPGALAYSVRHKEFTFHSGEQAEREFFTCLTRARYGITICLPSGRVSKKLERSLRAALFEGLQVTIFANADRESTYAVKRLRRLAHEGATVKICGGRLSSECAMVDDRWVYMGSLPRSWSPWLAPSCPVFLVNHSGISEEIHRALESQVSVEFNSPPVRLAARE